MTYLQLLEQLQLCSKETLQQDVTVYDISEDEFAPDRDWETCDLFN